MRKPMNKKVSPSVKRGRPPKADKPKTQWEIGLKHLMDFVEQHGHALIELKYETQNGFKLGRWVLTQKKNKETMTKLQYESLGAIPGWFWASKELNPRMDFGIEALSLSARSRLDLPPPQYRDPITGKTWDGLGGKPSWMEGRHESIFIVRGWDIH